MYFGIKDLSSMILIKYNDEKVFSSMELGNTSKSASFHSQAQRACGSTNHAPSAKTKPKA